MHAKRKIWYIFFQWRQLLELCGLNRHRYECLASLVACVWATDICWATVLGSIGTWSLITQKFALIPVSGSSMKRRAFKRWKVNSWNRKGRPMKKAGFEFELVRDCKADISTLGLSKPTECLTLRQNIPLHSCVRPSEVPKIWQISKIIEEERLSGGNFLIILGN